MMGASMHRRASRSAAAIAAQARNYGTCPSPPKTTFKEFLGSFKECSLKDAPRWTPRDIRKIVTLVKLTCMLFVTPALFLM